MHKALQELGKMFDKGTVDGAKIKTKVSLKAPKKSAPSKSK